MDQKRSAEVFAENLKRLMETSGKTAKEVAMWCKVTPATVSYWMGGKKYPRIEKMSALAEFFQVDKTDLMDERPRKRIDPQTIEARIISVGIDKMKPEDREKALNMMRIMFAEYMSGSDDDDTES
jgi:repressor LexA